MLRPASATACSGGLAFPRSTLYAQAQWEAADVALLRRARRGPKPTVCDADLLAAMRADLASSPATGEGHRKLWARLRIVRACFA